MPATLALSTTSATLTDTSGDAARQKPTLAHSPRTRESHVDLALRTDTSTTRKPRNANRSSTTDATATRTTSRLARTAKATAVSAAVRTAEHLNATSSASSWCAQLPRHAPEPTNAHQSTLAALSSTDAARHALTSARCHLNKDPRALPLPLLASTSTSSPKSAPSSLTTAAVAT